MSAQTSVETSVQVSARTSAAPSAPSRAGVGRRSPVRRPPKLRVVPGRVSRPITGPGFAVLVGVLLVAGVTGLLLFNTWVQQSAFTATAMEQRADRLAARQQSLELALEQKQDPQRLAAAARSLGMVPSLNPAFIRLSDGKVLGTPTPARPSDAMRIEPAPAKKPAELAPAPLVVEVPAPATSGTTPPRQGQQQTGQTQTGQTQTGQTQTGQTRTGQGRATR